MNIRSLIRNAFRNEAIKYGNVYLPAKHLRFCTTDWQDDDFFVRSAELDVERLMEYCRLSSESSLLDIGSGQGRLAVGLIRKLPGIHYLGVDVDPSSVSWCRRYIARYYPTFRFERINIQNARYNPTGQPITKGFHLPGKSGEFNVAFLYSVFTHMLSGDISAYLREVCRLLSPGGRVLMTAYVEPNVVSEQENPADYLLQFGAPSRPLHRVRFEHTFFETLIRDAGLTIVRFDHQSESMTGQSVIVAERQAPPYRDQAGS